MEGYKEYKNSNINCFEEVPSNWEVVPMKFFLKYEKGKNAAKYTKEFLEDNSNGKYPVYSGQTSNNGILGFINEWDYDLRGIIVSTVGAKAMSIKIVDNKFALSQNCALISVKKDFNIDYSYYILKILFDYEKNKLANIMIPSLRFEDLDTYKIIKPSLEEQQKIAAYLDYKTATIDEIIAKKQKLIAALDEKKKSIINDIVTGKNVWNGSIFTTPTQVKDSGIQWLGQIPEHWEVTKNKYITKITDGAHISPDRTSEDYDFVSTVDLNNGIINFDNCIKTSSENYHYLVKNGCKPKLNDVLYSKDGTIGKTCTIDFEKDFVVASSLIIISPNINIVRSKFLEFLYNSDFVKNQVELSLSGVAIRRVSLNKFSNLILVLPPIDEQDIIINTINNELSQINFLYKKLNTQIEKIKEYRQAVIAETVTGKIDVRHWTTPNN
ncbi:restriction endonuclease subunit S [Empedobacter falsenii]